MCLGEWVRVCQSVTQDIRLSDLSQTVSQMIPIVSAGLVWFLQ